MTAKDVLGLQSNAPASVTMASNVFSRFANSKIIRVNSTPKEMDSG